MGTEPQGGVGRVLGVLEQTAPGAPGAMAHGCGPYIGAALCYVKALGWKCHTLASWQVVISGRSIFPAGHPCTP